MSAKVSKLPTTRFYRNLHSDLIIEIEKMMVVHPGKSGFEVFDPFRGDPATVRNSDTWIPFFGSIVTDSDGETEIKELKTCVVNQWYYNPMSLEAVQCQHSEPTGFKLAPKGTIITVEVE